jgi:hypothetical protein
MRICRSRKCPSRTKNEPVSPSCTSCETPALSAHDRLDCPFYNPARPLGGLGVLLCMLAGLTAALLVSLRIAGVTVLGPWSATAVFSAVTLGIAGVDLFALGVVFNYVVSLFAKRPIRQGLFGRPLLKTPLERHFWWLGLGVMAAGLALGGASLALGLRGWPLERLWLYLLAGTMLVLVGLQLDVFWVIIRVLAELAQREALARADLGLEPRGNE